MSPGRPRRTAAGRFTGLLLDNYGWDPVFGFMAGTLASYRRVDELAEPRLPVKYPRTPGHRPVAAENPHNAWYWQCEIRGAAEGVLRAVSRPFSFEERIIQVGGFAGIASAPAVDVRIPDLIRRADIAMDRARSGRSARSRMPPRLRLSARSL